MKTFTPGIARTSRRRLFHYLIHRWTLAARLERHEQPAAIAFAGVYNQRIDRGIGADHTVRALQQLRHGWKGNILDCFHRDHSLTDILVGKKTFGQKHRNNTPVAIKVPTAIASTAAGDEVPSRACVRSPAKAYVNPRSNHSVHSQAEPFRLMPGNITAGHYGHQCERYHC